VPTNVSRPHVRINHVDYAVVDVETTGLFPGGHDRVVEAAVLRYAPDGALRRRWVTLVNPGRDMGATHVHGIAAADVADAPRFADIVGDVCTLLRDTVVIAHNARFDMSFLAAEFARAGHHLPSLPAVCTMTLPTRLGLASAGRSLKAACQQWGVAYDDSRAHGALHDAEAAAAVFGRLLEAAWRTGARTIDQLGCTCAVPPATDWPVTPGAARTHGRRAADSHRQQQFGYLSKVAHRVADAALPGPVELAPYLDVLDRVLEDHVVTAEEANGLVAVAREWGLSSEQVRRAHEVYLHDLVDAAWEDGVVTDTERRELETVGFWLGINAEEVAAVTERRRSSAAAPSPAEPNEESHPLIGQTVCFTGALVSCRNGRALTRAEAQQLAADAGLAVVNGVSKNLDILVVADPDTQSGKAVKARQYGTRILAEAVFWRIIGVTVD
jgi:DNA polymerase-3 subunit epsilon